MGFVVVYVAVYFSCLRYERLNFSRAEVKFRYDSDWGRALGFLYILGWGWFSYGTPPLHHHISNHISNAAPLFLLHGVVLLPFACFHYSSMLLSPFAAHFLCCGALYATTQAYSPVEIP